MDEDRFGWGDVVRMRREAFDMTQNQLAKVASVSLKSVGNLENGTVVPQRGTLRKIQEALGLSSDLKVARVQSRQLPPNASVPEVGRQALGQLIATRRLALSLEDDASLARRLGVAPKVLTDLERGVGELDERLKGALEDALHWRRGSVDRVLTGIDPIREDVPSAPKSPGAGARPPSRTVVVDDSDELADALASIAAVLALIPSASLDDATAGAVRAILLHLDLDGALALQQMLRTSSPSLDALNRPLGQVRDFLSDTPDTTTQGGYSLVADEDGPDIDDEQENRNEP
ncbi:helix-turn-helix transcriptional regulator [Nocardioides sp. Bht2]|uniref:helix-turn-helix transcriptional regulator n=1 Tax=Nocardioides sp. Bht2 TaxID=3392297 RepID=UPI0039B64E00